MKKFAFIKRILSAVMAIVTSVSMLPAIVHGADTDTALNASLAEAKSYIDGITVNNSSNDPATVVKTFKKHFTWDNEKRENSKSYLFDWSYYNGVVFEGIEYLYEVTGSTTYKDYVVEYMSSLINANGTWATCTNSGYTSKQCAGYNSTHGADCYKTASLLLDTYEMTGDSRYLTMAATLYKDLDNAAKSYSLSKAGNNYRHTWASDPSPDLWLDGLYMILPFRAEYAKYTGDTAELNLIVSRMQWVSDNMYNSSKGLFYHAADSASSNSGTYWLRSIGWYAAAIVDIMDSMDGSNLEAMKTQLKKLVDGMKACQNSSNGMWLNNMNASKSSSNPYETSGTALVCYAVMKAVNNGWLDKSYADMAILAFNGICNEKLNGSTLTDICFKGAPGSSNSTFYNNEGKGVGPFIMFYAEVLEYVNNAECDHDYETETVDATCTENGVITYTCDCGDSYTEEIPAKGHDYEGEVTVPTCTEGGYTTYICEACGDSYTADYTGAKGHSYTAETVDATCTANGVITYTCDCGDSYTEEIPAKGHDYEGEVTAPTCTEGGYTTYICEACGNSYTCDEIPALGHDYETETVDATCTEGGYTARTCVVCGDSYTADYTDALGHDWVSEVTEADCENAGYTTHTCTVCGDITVDNHENALGHDYETETVDATCTEDGYVSSVCARCGDSDYEVIEAAGHAYETETADATCTEDGYVITVCAVCGDTAEEILPALGHDYEAEVTAPTCEAEGYTVYTCVNCGDSYTDDYTDALGHDYDMEVTAPTCEAEGYTVYTCVNCGDSYTDDYTDALGHDYDMEVTAPTCEAEGYTVYTCVNCGDSYTDDYTDALGHDYEAEVTAPTCEAEGYTVYTCVNCGDSYTDDYTDALGHDYDMEVIAPTCEAEGYTAYTCVNCGDSYTDDYTDALGHDYDMEEADGYLVYTCGHCGDTYSEEIETGHTYTKVSSISSGNEYVVTVYSGRKYYALSHAGNRVTAVQVSVSNGEITSEITDDMVWSYSNSRLSYVSGGTTYYMYASGSSNNWWGGWWGSTPTLSISKTNSSKVSFSSSRLKVGSYYIYYGYGSVSLSSYGSTVNMFLED